MLSKKCTLAMCTNDSDMANDSEQQLTQLSIPDKDQRGSASDFQFNSSSSQNLAMNSEVASGPECGRN